jgi:chromosome segregation protein
MYLKEIEISGFKSFADKININLDNNITCVVGPNGSGKSNIVDAVRWVLGEQSVKSLRGDGTMSDVIFSGSKSRKPLNVASVMLTFDNSDNYLNMPYNTVSIKRRAYRSGESEYFLNGEKCRLKDITELFLDTGVSKSSFNIISQGEISRILSSSPVERRFVVEEAAGILKYKTRREEALRKLDKTINNISRVNDIIGELELRVEPLREQSEKAQEYLEVKDKLKDIEVSLLVSEITDINNVYQENKKKIEKLNNEIVSINTLISNNKLEEVKVKSLELEKEINELNNELIIKTRNEEELNSKRNIVHERSKYDAKDIQVHENISMLKNNKLSLSNDIKLLEKDIEDMSKNLEVAKKNMETLLNALSDAKIKKDNLNKEYNIKNKELLENTNRINIIKDNLENNLLVNSNVKKILNNPRLTGVHDAFGNILSTESMYSKALEVIIGASKNFIIVDNSDVAKECIEFLKNNKLGRATFYPLDVIKPKGIDYDTTDAIENESGYLGILSDFVKYEDKYRNIVLNQLGNIIVTKDIDTGNRLSRIINNKYKIVTLDGEVIHVGGSITGGSINPTVSPITLKNELADLIVSNNSLQTVCEELTRNITNQNSNIISIEEDVYNTRSDYTRFTEIKANLENNLELKKQELDNVNLELNNLGDLEGNKLVKEEEKITEEYYKAKEERELLAKDINIKRKEYDKIKGEILNLEGDVKVYNNDLRNKEKELKDLEISQSRMDAKLDNNLEILSSDYEMTYEKAREEYSLDTPIDEARTLVNKYKNKIKSIGMVNILAIDEFKEVNERYTFLTSQRDDLLHAKETLYSIIDEMDEVMKEDFGKTFELLKDEFKKVFQMLFKGGTATLKLTDPTDLLTTGIDVIASPPGKSLKTINLLSGGEKTLTAISLLFAVLNIRKVPFCIFDEIEAALDENNVDIFGHYLDNYKNKTQFLLITHKKRTMEYAKTLYGITMQESGVSKLVSVKLEN